MGDSDEELDGGCGGSDELVFRDDVVDTDGLLEPSSSGSWSRMLVTRKDSQNSV